MKAKTWVVVCGMMLSLALWAQVASAGEAANLARIRESVTKLAKGTEDARQRGCLENAAGALGNAEQAVNDEKEKDAKKEKRKALKWLTWAAKECADVGSLPGEVGGSLVAEGGMSKEGLDRLKTLFDLLKKAKKNKEKSDFPIEQEMAIKELVNAILQAIDSGGAEVTSSKALKWYLNAAATCDDVQDMIKELLDYINTAGSIGAEARDQAKKMVDELYEMKAAGASFEEIVAQAEKIKKFIDDEYTRVARERLKQALEEEEEKEKEEQRAAGIPRGQTTTVRFTALDGETQVNKQFVGDIQSIRFVAVDGEELPSKEVAADVSVHDDSYTVSIGKAAKIGTIVLAGTGGIVRLVQDGEGSPRAGLTSIEPKDGTIDVGNGSVSETFNVASGLVETERAPQDHSVSIGGKNAHVVATRGNQVAATASGLEPPTAGTTPVEFESPSGNTVTGKCPAWGYNISIPPTTKTNVWVPISAEVFGLGPTDRVTFLFLPTPGQQINPQEVTIQAGEAVAPTPIAQLMVEQPGAQALNVVVTRETE